MPQNCGEYSLNHNIYRPPYGKRDEWFMKTPTGRVGALIPEFHSWIIEQDGTLTITPSIVYFDYHGFLKNGIWTD